MPVDREKFLLEARRRIIQEATLEERLEGLTVEQILSTSTPQQCLELLAGENRLGGYLQLVILQRLESAGVAHMLTCDMRKKLLSVIAEYRSAQP